MIFIKSSIFLNFVFKVVLIVYIIGASSFSIYAQENTCGAYLNHKNFASEAQIEVLTQNIYETYLSLSILLNIPARDKVFNDKEMLSLMESKYYRHVEEINKLFIIYGELNESDKLLVLKGIELLIEKNLGSQAVAREDKLFLGLIDRLKSASSKDNAFIKSSVFDVVLWSGQSKSKIPKMDLNQIAATELPNGWDLDELERILDSTSSIEMLGLDYKAYVKLTESEKIEILNTYRKGLIRKYHPDRNLNSPKIFELSEFLMKKINSAYDDLKSAVNNSTVFKDEKFIDMVKAQILISKIIFLESKHLSALEIARALESIQYFGDHLQLWEFYFQSSYIKMNDLVATGGHENFFDIRKVALGLLYYSYNSDKLNEEAKFYIFETVLDWMKKLGHSPRHSLTEVEFRKISKLFLQKYKKPAQVSYCVLETERCEYSPRKQAIFQWLNKYWWALGLGSLFVLSNM